MHYLKIHLFRKTVSLHSLWWKIWWDLEINRKSRQNGISDSLYKTKPFSLNLCFQGMDTVESLEPEKFTSYLQEYHNTICGRHPIGIMMNTVKHARELNPNSKWSFKFVKYAQSEQCRSSNSSSVSYAAGSLLQIEWCNIFPLYSFNFSNIVNCRISFQYSLYPLTMK